MCIACQSLHKRKVIMSPTLCVRKGTLSSQKWFQSSSCGWDRCQRAEDKVTAGHRPPFSALSSLGPGRCPARGGQVSRPLFNTDQSDAQILVQMEAVGNPTSRHNMGPREALSVAGGELSARPCESSVLGLLCRKGWRVSSCDSGAL